MTPNKLEQKSVNTLLPLLTSEYDAFYHYRALSNWCKGVGYEKAAEFFAKESEDELSHAKKIEQYDNNSVILCDPIKNNIMSEGNFIRGDFCIAKRNIEMRIIAKLLSLVLVFMHL